MTSIEGVIVERREAVTVVRMDRGENRFHPDLLTGLEAVLDELGGNEDPAALVLTGAGKFFSNGLDLDYMGANPDEVESIVVRVQRIYGRILGLDVPTVAAVNGHAFAGGGMLMLGFDQVVMREDRGYFCLPEADLGIPFTPGMNELVRSRLSPPVAHRAMVTAERFPGTEALAAGIVTELAAEEAVLDRAVELAAARVGKPRQALGVIKQRLYGEAIELLEAGKLS